MSLADVLPARWCGTGTLTATCRAKHTHDEHLKLWKDGEVESRCELDCEFVRGGLATGTKPVIGVRRLVGDDGYGDHAEAEGNVQGLNPRVADRKPGPSAIRGDGGRSGASLYGSPIPAISRGCPGLRCGWLVASGTS
jgi:hypothetical protein